MTLLPAVGIFLAQKLGLAATEHVSSVLTIISMCINLSSTETLKPSEKKSFRLSNGARNAPRSPSMRCTV